MPRPIRATIDLPAFVRNLARARQHAGSARTLAVLKADAYGHGLDRLLPAVAAADGIAVLEIDAAARVRAAGFAGPLVLLEGCFDGAELTEAARLGLSPVLHAPEQVDELMATALRQPLDVWLKFNSGMNRLGLRASAFGNALARLEASGRVRSMTLMTHFASADDGRGVSEQAHAFEQVTGTSAHPRSLANSAALLRYPDTRADWVRPGIVLYGATPFSDEGAAALGFEPVMTLASRVIAVQDLAAGESVGYGWSYRAPQAMRIGVVACGYADGYPRQAATGTPVQVSGVRTGTVGRVSMDMLYVDLTPVPEAAVGAPVELWGRSVPVDEVAARAGTVGYELLCALAPRVPVVVRGPEAPPEA